MNHTRTQPSTSSRDSAKGEKGFVLGFHGVRYQVKDVRRSVEFYTTDLGFKLGHQALPAFANVSIENLTMLLSGPEALAQCPMVAIRNREDGTASFFGLPIFRHE